MMQLFFKHPSIVIAVYQHKHKHLAISLLSLDTMVASQKKIQLEYISY